MARFWGEPFARAYMATEGRAPIYRIAQGLLQAWQQAPVSITPNECIAGNPLPEATVRYHYGSGISFQPHLAQQLLADATLCTAEHQLVQQVIAHFSGHGTIDQLRARQASEVVSTPSQAVYWAGGWGGHILLDYGYVLRLGTSGIRTDILRLAGEQTPMSDFHAALLAVCDMLDTIAQRYRDVALRQAAELNNLDPTHPRITQLQSIAATLARVPHFPASTWQEAVQCFWLVFVADGIDSPGRFDQYMYPYWQTAYAAGGLKQQHAIDLLAELWQKFEAVRAWNLCVGGQKEDGTDATNSLSLAILDLAAQRYQVAPNLTMRCHSHTPAAMWEKAAASIATGNGMPALYNDDVVIDALTAHGIPLVDARGYAMNGCNQIDIPGKSHMGLEDGEINLLKCLELALHNGVDPLCGQQIGPKTDPAGELDTFTDLIRALEEQIAYFVAELCRAANLSQRVYAEHAPDPLRTLLVTDCLAQGRDIKSGGARYNHGQVLLQGIGNTADSLMTIKRLVFQDGILTLQQLNDVLSTNWQGNEPLRQRVLHTMPHFGNDMSEVDALAAHVVDFTLQELKKHRTFRGGYYAGGSSVYVRGVEHGANVGATPDGRFSRTPLADSVGAVQGRDLAGPTALLKSAAQPDQRLAISGYVLNLRFAKSLVAGEGMQHAMEAVKVYFAQGGQQVQINVLDAVALRQARSDPQLARSLIVRVGGYSDYFGNLSPQLQDEIITRTEHSA